MTTMHSDLTLTGVTVVNTRGGELAPGMTVVIEDGRITRVAPDGAAIPGSNTIHAPGKFVVPGYSDMHAHVVDDEHRDSSLDLLLAHGVTSWRQMSGSPEFLAQRREGRLSLPPDRPEMLEMPGQILTPANAASDEAAIAEVRRQKEQGADFIKTIMLKPKAFFLALEEARRLGLGYSGHISPGVNAIKAANAGMTSIEHLGGPLEMQLITCSSRAWMVLAIMNLKPPKPPDLSPEKMATVGKMIVASPTLFRMQMSAKSLSQSQQLVDTFSEARCRKLADACAKHGTWQTPTLIRVNTMQAFDDPRFTQSPDLRYIPQATRQFWSSIAQKYTEIITPAGRETIRRMMELALKMTKIFDERGVKMLAGSDYGGGWVIPGVSMHQEFDLLEEAGLSPLKILQMTTLAPAQFLKRESTMGTVEPGRDADLVLLDRNPIESAQNLHGIHAVVRGGRLYSSADLEALKRNVASRMAAGPDALAAG